MLSLSERPMRIIFALDYLEGGTWHVATPLATALRDRGHEVRFLSKAESIPEDLSTWDLIHAWNMRAGNRMTDGPLPVVQTINSFIPRDANNYIETARAADAIHVHSPYVAQFLFLFGGVKGANFIPATFDHSRCEPIPLPETFTVGWLGSDRSYKRFKTARQIAEKAGVPYIEWDVDALHPWKKVRDEFFPAISCYLLASFNEASPLPPQEGLLFGRPVATTCVGMMNMIVQDGVNGKMFDGSVDGDVYALKAIQEDLLGFRQRALQTKLIKTEEVAPQYLELYERVLNG